MLLTQHSFSRALTAGNNDINIIRLGMHPPKTLHKKLIIRQLTRRLT